MKIKNIYYDDFVNYGGHCCLTIAMPYCSFKCGEGLCQNSALAKSKTINYPDEKIITAFISSSLMDTICFQGLEPLDSWDELKYFLLTFRKVSRAPVVIYTGYNKDEVGEEKLNFLHKIKNVIIKYGRFIPHEKPHWDEILQVNLASSNQFAEEL